MMACNLAAEESMKNVSVLNTKCIPEGLASMMSYNNELDINTNISNLENYTNDMIFGVISLASRSGVMNNIEYKEGEYIVVIDDEADFDTFFLVVCDCIKSCMACSDNSNSGAHIFRISIP